MITSSLLEVFSAAVAPLAFADANKFGFGPAISF
jgi:hypothetical protein